MPVSTRPHAPDPATKAWPHPPPLPAETAGAAWAGWTAAHLARFVGDLLAHELGRLRPGQRQLPPQPWAAALALDADGLGLDSLERMSLAAALNEALHLHESGLEDLLLVHRHLGGWIEVAGDALAEVHEHISFHSSGSTGEATACRHRLATLWQEVDAIAPLVPGTRRVLAAVPAHHIYGFLFTVLLPHRLGSVPVIDIRRHTPQGLAALLQPGDLVISQPAHWALLARHLPRWPAGVRGVSSTAPCPDALATRLQAAGLDELLQIYGSSQTAGIGWRRAAGAAFTLWPFWSVDQAVQADAADQADDTRLWREDPQGQREAHALQDHLAWAGPRQFHVTGRRDAAVQVAGTNVYPARVRDLLCQHPQVADAAVRRMAAHEGDRLKAFVVPRPGADWPALQAALWGWTAARLSAPETPKAFTLGEQLPVNAMGKPADWPIDP